MKFLHLSDLHIGKRVNGFSMLEDQRFILKQVIDLSESEGADGVWIAGDIYDKSVPSAEAVQLFDAFLTELTRRGKRCFMISGNHDSAERIAFGARWMDHCGIYLSPVFSGKIEPVELEDAYGKLRIYLMPFLKPAYVRQVYPEAQIESTQEAVRLVIGQMDVDPDCRNVILAHQFITGAACCESEELSIGGLDQVSADLFEPFDYAALGHLHVPQTLGDGKVRYCGTLLKYSFSEARGEKSVTVVELKEKGTVEWSTIPLKPRKDLRELRGTYMELTDRNTYQGTQVEDYLHITLTDEEDVPDALGKLRSIYPNIMKLDYDNLRTRSSQSLEAGGAAENKTPMELLEELYQLQNNQGMSEKQREFAQEMIERIWSSEQ